MPGRSYEGPVPELDADEGALCAELESDVRRLGEGIGERSIDRPEAMKEARTYIEARLASFGYAPRNEPFQARGHEVANAIAEVPGAARAAEIVVVGAHYDSAWGSPGANDNATGVAALLALAKRFAVARLSR